MSCSLVPSPDLPDPLILLPKENIYTIESIGEVLNPLQFPISRCDAVPPGSLNPRLPFSPALARLNAGMPGRLTIRPSWVLNELPV
jgi:hypothetical protein